MRSPNTHKLLVDVFLRVADHLLSQGKQSVKTYPSGDKSCRYQSPDGLKCAVGCLIPDELYGRYLEGERVNSSVVLEAIRVGNVVGVDLPPAVVDLLGGLQEVHDGCDPELWPSVLNRLADSFDIPVQFATV